jgi:hypothetical protein
MRRLLGLPHENPTQGLCRVLWPLGLGNELVRPVDVECQPCSDTRTVVARQDSFVGARPVKRVPAVMQVGRLGRWRAGAALLPIT